MAEPEIVLSVFAGAEWIRRTVGPLMSIVVALGTVICIPVTLKIIFTKELQARRRAEEVLKDVISVIMVLILVISVINIITAIQSDMGNGGDTGNRQSYSGDGQNNLWGKGVEG